MPVPRHVEQVSLVSARDVGDGFDAPSGMMQSALQLCSNV
jgi:hypothetical protein